MHKNLSIEISLWEKGYDYVIGVDEVGRGCLAGPICAGAVAWEKEKLISLIRDEKSNIHKIKDSKKIVEKRRIELSSFIQDEAFSFSVCQVSPSEIDREGIQNANRKVMIDSVKKVINKIGVGKKYIVITDYLDINIENVEILPVLYGDSTSISISSASIIAKVYRDTLMKKEMHEKFSIYGFDKHVGYGTKLHIEMIKEYGLSEIHRRSFCGKLLAIARIARVRP